MSDFALPPDPLDHMSLKAFGDGLRSGAISVEATVEHYLDRIASLDRRLGAFEFVDAGGAVRTAQALDSLLRAGVDLGPLMGVPIAVKDLFAIAGTPTTAGSRIDVSDLVGEEGPFIGALRRAGAVILGKTKTVEFAFGAAGTNTVRGTPWNPCDATMQRIPGGSSSGSAVAVAAGMCALAIGTDTGGSVRVPATLCGLFGLKTTVGVFDTAGVFPLSATFDSIGILARSAADAALAFATLTGRVVESLPISRLRLGLPLGTLFDGIDQPVSAAFDVALQRLTDRGARLVDIRLEEARERQDIFPIVLAVELLATLGRERFERHRAELDPLVEARIARGADVPAVDYFRFVRRHHEIVRIVQARMRDLDAWVAPTVAIVPRPVGDLSDVAQGLKLTAGLTQNSQPVNLFGQCGVTLPIHQSGSELPVGLQLASAPFAEHVALGAALAIEEAMGAAKMPDLDPFFAAPRA